MQNSVPTCSVCERNLRADEDYVELKLRQKDYAKHIMCICVECTLKMFGMPYKKLFPKK